MTFGRDRSRGRWENRVIGSKSKRHHSYRIVIDRSTQRKRDPVSRTTMATDNNNIRTRIIVIIIIKTGINNNSLLSSLPGRRLPPLSTTPSPYITIITRQSGGENNKRNSTRYGEICTHNLCVLSTCFASGFFLLFFFQPCLQQRNARIYTEVTVLRANTITRRRRISKHPTAAPGVIYVRVIFFSVVYRFCRGPNADYFRIKFPPHVNPITSRFRTRWHDFYYHHHHHHRRRRRRHLLLRRWFTN